MLMDNVSIPSASDIAGKLKEGATGLTNAISGGALTGALDSIQKEATAALTSATSILGADISSIASKGSDAIKGLIGKDTANLAAGAVKTDIGDALQSSIARLVPNGASFATNKLTAQLESLDIAGIKSLGISELTKVGPGLLSAMAGKLGVSIPSTDGLLKDLKSVATGALKDSALGGVFSKLESVIPSGIVSTITDVASTVGQIKDFKNFASTAVAKFAGSTEIGQKLSGFYASGMPLSASQTGAPIPGIPTSSDPSFLSGISKVASSFGIQVPGLSNVTQFSTNQNLFNSTLGLSAQSGIVSAVSSFGASSQFNQSSASTLNSALPQIAQSGNLDMVDTIIGLIGKKNVSKKDVIINALLGTQNDPSRLNTTFASLGTSPSAVFGTDTYVGDNIVWNGPRLDAYSTNSGMPGSSIDALIGKTISKFLNKKKKIPMTY
jgi:hypothetical protein